MLRLKDNVNPVILENYGFKLGQEFVDNGEIAICNESDYQDYWKFSMDPDEPDKISYADEDMDQAMVSIHIQSDMSNRLWIECVPSSSYHIEGWELNVITDTLLDLSTAGILELIPE